jgi:hypothetical protein
MLYEVSFEGGGKKKHEAPDDIGLIKILITEYWPNFPSVTEIRCITHKRIVSPESIKWIKRMLNQALFQAQYAVATA